MRYFYFCCILVLCLSSSGLRGQSNSAIREYQQTPIRTTQNAGSTWGSITGGETFSEQPIKQQKPEEYNNSRNYEGGSSNFPVAPRGSSNYSMSPLVQVIVYTILITGLLILIVFMVTGSIFSSPNNPNIGVKAEFNIENVDATIPESELQRLLRESLNTQNYRAAIRLYYIAIVKHLADKQLISWQKDKTNMMYCREIRETPQYQPFSQLTRIYERVWFSEHQFDKNAFESVKPDFESFLKA